MSADPDLELCGCCVARQLGEPEDGHCKICGDELAAGRVCSHCQIDLERLVGVATGKLRLLLPHTARIEVGGQITVESDLAI